MKCPVCGKEMKWVGFKRELITRGKNKGTYWVEDFYKPCCKYKGTKQLLSGENK